MELDDLKILWKSGNGFQPKDETEIASLLKGKSKSIVDKLKRNVWLEVIFTLAGGTSLLLYALSLENGSLKWTSISIIVLFATYTFYYIKKLFLLHKFDIGKQSLKSNLEVLINSLTGYLKYYRRSYTLLYPAYFLLALSFSVIELGTDEFIRIISKPDTILYLASILVLILFCSTWVTKWYLKKLYGNHLAELKTILADLQAN